MNLRRVLFLLLLGLAGLTGCQTAMTFNSPAEDWPSYQGQAHYSNAAGRSVVGEFVVRRAPATDEFQLQFSSGPGFPLLKLWEAGNGGRAEGVFARGHWQGRLSAAPAGLKNWVRMRDVFAQLSPGRTDLRGPGWTARASYTAGAPARCEIDFAEGGERFAFQFSR